VPVIENKYCTGTVPVIENKEIFLSHLEHGEYSGSVAQAARVSLHQALTFTPNAIPFNASLQSRKFLLARIRDVSPGSDFSPSRIPEPFPSRIRIKKFKYFNPQNGF
jgi:hypothetical protein